MKSYKYFWTVGVLSLPLHGQLMHSFLWMSLTWIGLYVFHIARFNRFCLILPTFIWQANFTCFALILLVDYLPMVVLAPKFGGAILEFLIYLPDVNQICISTSCSCTFTLKFYLEAYMYFIRILNLLCLLHMVLKNYMLIIQVFYSLCLFSIEIQMNPLIYC